MLESKTEQTRIFGQLQGKETWVKSDMEVAAEEALQKTQEKYEERMKGLIKKKGNKKSPDDLDAINEESVNDNLVCQCCHRYEYCLISLKHRWICASEIIKGVK